MTTDENQTRKIINSNVQRQVHKQSFFSQFTQAECTWEVGPHMFPLSIIFVCMITFNNTSLKLVEVAFYNVTSSFTIVFNLLFIFVFLRSTINCKKVLRLGAVIFGFLIGTVGKLINLNMRGAIFGSLRIFMLV